MTHLADDSPAALFGSADPAIVGQLACVDSILNAQAASLRPKKFFDYGSCWSKAAIKADHQHRLQALFPKGRKLFCKIAQFLLADAKRLFHKNCPAGAKCTKGQCRMGIVAGGDNDGIGGWIREHVIRLRSTIIKPEFLGSKTSIQAARADYASQLDGLHPANCRKQHVLREHSRADKA